jgi:raw
MELEHRAKEKSRILFFVMDSETRASAGAIEAAHIAGQNLKHLVLVLHPYKPDQKILNENISPE